MGKLTLFQQKVLGELKKGKKLQARRRSYEGITLDVEPFRFLDSEIKKAISIATIDALGYQGLTSVISEDYPVRCYVVKLIESE